MKPQRSFLAWPLLALLLLMGCSQPTPPDSSFKLAQQGLLSAALSPDGRFLFTGSFQHGGALWDQQLQGRLYDWNHTEGDYSAYHSADFSEDGQYLAATDGTAVVVWEVASGNARMYLESPAQTLTIQNTADIWASTDGLAADYWQKPARIVDLALSQQYLLLGLENQVALLIDISRRTIIGALGHDDVITDVAMDDNATYAITGTRSGTVSLWSLGDGSLVEQQQYQNPIVYTAISPDGTSFISAAATGPVVLTQLNQTVGQQTLFKGNPGIISANFSAQNRLLLGSSREKVWEFDMTTGAKLKTWQVPIQGPWHKAAIMSLHKDSEGVQAIASDGIAYQLH